MSKRKIIYVTMGIITCFFVLIAAILGKNQSKSPTEILSVEQSVYYVEKENSSIKAEKKEIGGETLLEMLNNAVVLMGVTPKSETLTVAIPEGLEILDISLKENLAIVNFSSNYNLLKTGDEMFCRAALVWTLTDFYFVDEVEIMVNGSALRKTNGEPFGALGRDELIIDAQIEAEPTNSSRIFKLYFANADASALVTEDRRVEVNPNQPLEKYVLEQLIIGPKVETHVSTVPAETKIRNIQTQDGICYVDLSQDFVNKHLGGSTGELFTVYSIVNSLCQLSGVEKVQFLIEGEKQEEFKGHLDFGKPFEPSPVN